MRTLTTPKRCSGKWNYKAITSIRRSRKQVMQRLVAAGYRVTSQWPVGAYRINLVVEGLNRTRGRVRRRKVAHTRAASRVKLSAKQFLSDSVGLCSLSGSVFFRNADAAMSPVFAKLADLEIEALGPASDSRQAADSPSVERIRRCAEALRTQWLADKTLEAGLPADVLRSRNSSISSIHQERAPLEKATW